MKIPDDEFDLLIILIVMSRMSSEGILFLYIFYFIFILY